MAEAAADDVASRRRLIVRLPNHDVDESDGRLEMGPLAALLKGLGVIFGRPTLLGEHVEPVLRRADEGSLELVVELITAAQDYYRQTPRAEQLIAISTQLATIIAAIATVFGVIATVSLQIMAIKAPDVDRDELRLLLMDPWIRRALREMRVPLRQTSSHLSEPDLVLEMDGSSYPVKAEAVDWLLQQAPRPTHRPTEQVLIEVLGSWTNKAVHGPPSITMLGTRWRSDPETFLVRDPVLGARLSNKEGAPAHILADVRPSTGTIADYDLLRVHQFIGFTFGEGDPDDRGEAVPIRA